jgi:hypothetical protein
MANGRRYDVAISFLAQDEPTAAELHSQLSDGLNIFFFPRNQEEPAGWGPAHAARLEPPHQRGSAWPLNFSNS